MQRRNFIKTTGTYTLLFPYMKNFGGAVLRKDQHFDTDLKSMCVAAFHRFEEVWEFNDFWKRGNTFDACLNFADALHQQWPGDDDVKMMQQKVSAMLQKNLDFFKSIDPSRMWADDFGWWGLMAINARKHLLRSGNKDLADAYLRLSADSCWRQERDHAYDFSDTAKPVPHGCRNGDANGQNKGVKNTVTNVLFFLLSVKLCRLMLAEQVAGSKQYLEMAYRQWVWFDSWFQLTQYEYLKKTTSGGALVQERPTAFFQGSDYAVTTHPTWEKGWAWTGDQGMLLTALTGMLAIKNDLAEWIAKNNIDPGFNVDTFAEKTNDYILSIGKGIQSALVGDKDGIIREAPFVSNMGPEFGNDYLAGRGILMRYLGMPDKTIDFSHTISSTVNAIWQTRNKSDNQFQPEFTNPENDELYLQQFKKQWGAGDDILKWDIATMDDQQKFGVCQSIGLDALGAMIHQTL